MLVLFLLVFSTHIFERILDPFYDQLLTVRRSGEQFRHLRHLVGRFFASLSRREPVDRRDVACVAARCSTPPEFAVLGRDARPRRPGREPSRRCAGSPPDGRGRRSLGRGRAAPRRRQGEPATSAPFGRVAGHRGAAAVGDAAPARGAGRVGRYLRHDELGADLLGSAGARAEVVAWAAAHHRPGPVAGRVDPGRTSVPPSRRPMAEKVGSRG